MLIYPLAFPTQVLSWGKQMVAMSGSGPGYSQTIIITPYMHASLIYHVPALLRRHGSLRLFSGQGKYSCRLTLFSYLFENYVQWYRIQTLNFKGKEKGKKKIDKQWVRKNLRFPAVRNKNFRIKYFIQLLDTMLNSIWTHKTLLNFF